jgi:4-hydroxybenzoate polyprenyltransferase
VSPVALILGLSVAVWIAGFDVIYGCQDVEFDKAHGLHSMPVRFGLAGALRLSKLMHIVSIAGFIIVGNSLNLHSIYYVGVAVAAGVLIFQHLIVSPANLSKVTQKYFMRNGLVGITMLVFTIFALYSGK